jgi:hypothetical protein
MDADIDTNMDTHGHAQRHRDLDADCYRDWDGKLDPDRHGDIHAQRDCLSQPNSHMDHYSD